MSIIRHEDICPVCGNVYISTFVQSEDIEQPPKKLLGECYKCKFKINVNDPKYNDLYKRFLKWKQWPTVIPLTDELRLEFESYVLSKEEKKKASSEELA